MTQSTGFGDSNIKDTQFHIICDNGVITDITSLFTKLQFSESIFSNTIYGVIDVSETYDLPSTIPLVGGERIKISFTSYGIKDEKSDHQMSGTRIEKTFVIYKITGYSPNINKSSISYTLHFVSEHFIINEKKRLRRNFGSEKIGIKGSQIVRDICEKQLEINPKFLFIEETRFDRWIVCPNWTPFYAINYVAKSDISSLSSATQDKNSTFIFFEDTFGFKFVSLATLLEDKLYTYKLIDNLNFGDITSSQSNSSFVKTSDPVLVESYAFNTLFDEIDNIFGGLYNSRFFYHNIVKKEYKEEQYHYENDFLKMSHVEMGKSLPINGNRKFYPSENTVLLHGEYHNENMYQQPDKWNQYNRSRLQALNNYSLSCNVAGNSGHRIGNVVNCEIPSGQKDSNGGITSNKFMSGKYLLSDITHTITKDSYKMNLNLIKDCLRKN